MQSRVILPNFFAECKRYRSLLFDKASEKTNAADDFSSAMVKSTGATVASYLQSLSPEKRAHVEKVRAIILKNLPDGYEEVFRWNMITYEIPLDRYPDTYNKQPLMYAALAAQKNYFSLYLTCVYSDKTQEKKLRTAFEKIGKTPNMGKSCIRFKQIEDIPLTEIGTLIAATSVDEHIRQYEASRGK